MATNIPAPPTKTPGKGEPPPRQETRGNLAKPEPGGSATLNFRVTEEFKRDFKIAAASRGLSLSDLLDQAFNVWNKQHG